MRFGLFCSAQANSNELGPETGQGFRDYLDFNVEAEALGYHSSFSVEHHFTGWNQVLRRSRSRLAMRTTTLRLGTAVIVLPWHHPVLLAEQAATLDLISDGRLDFGIARATGTTSSGLRHSARGGGSAV
jgi:alkanesulfonate monooxygenase SsuD/methylene tetrahydromethanopterin reductase-like flavin-dependent oxidoreductase (luciferase family)